MSGSRKRKPMLKKACNNSNSLRLKEPFVNEPEEEESDFPITPILCRKPSVQELLIDQISKTTRTKSGKIRTSTRRRVFFILGSFLGFCIAYFFAAGPGQDIARPIVSNWTNYLNEQLHMSEVDWGSILPDNTIVDDLLRNFTGRLFPERAPPEPAEGSPGAKLRDLGVVPKHPVFFVPGIISTGLESWGVENCSKKYFRQRLWGTMTMFRSVLTDRNCWLQSMKLDEVTGLDPPGFKLRAAQGLDAADYFVTGYWVWGKVIENFAAVGYDNNNMHLAAYDWRLTYENLEKRDKFFSGLKSMLEQSKLNSGEKAVVLSHSMGSLVWYYFLKWVEGELGGNGGPQWVEDHVHATVNIAGALLGAPKTMPTLLSGEQRETVQPMAQYVLERFFSRKERAKLFRNWGGLWSLMPKGGDAVWGDHHSAPDDLPSSLQRTNGEMFVMSHDSITGHNFTVSEAFNLLFASSNKYLEKNMLRSYSFGAAKSDRDLRNDEPIAWSNPLETSLPDAPSMKFYCLYGHGLGTERSYNLDETDAVELLDETSLPYIVNGDANDPSINLSSGVKASNGDGSVPLLSLGYMCVEGWKKKRFNPAGLKVITREFNHTAVPIYEDIRGGPDTGDHIDILGNSRLTYDVLRIATGYDDDLDDRIESEIREISSLVPL